MRVLLLGRDGFLDSISGEKMQIEQTAGALRRLGVKLDVKSGLNVDMSGYDLVHVFQMDWYPDCYFQIKSAKALGLPVVFSPIHHKLQEVERFDNEYVFDFRRISKYLFKDQFSRDAFKDLYRALLKPSRMGTVLNSILYGRKNMYIYALKKADVVLVQTQKEAEDLKRTFLPDINWKIIRNGVGDNYLHDMSSSKQVLPFVDYLLCVGRIEPRKNQLSVIKAVKLLREETKQDLRLVFIGQKPVKKHFEYTYLFNKEVKQNPWILHIQQVPYDQMPAYFRFAKVGISASWFETTGLTSLEALFCGTNAVATGERAKEYLADYASYCDPGDIEGIKEAIKKEYYASRPTLSPNLRVEYTWENAAKQTCLIYDQLLVSKRI